MDRYLKGLKKVVRKRQAELVGKPMARRKREISILKGAMGGRR